MKAITRFGKAKVVDVEINPNPKCRCCYFYVSSDGEYFGEMSLWKFDSKGAKDLEQLDVAIEALKSIRSRVETGLSLL